MIDSDRLYSQVISFQFTAIKIFMVMIHVNVEDNFGFNL
jgi:hypothetical protein